MPTYLGQCPVCGRMLVVAIADDTTSVECPCGARLEVEFTVTLTEEDEPDDTAPPEQ